MAIQKLVSELHKFDDTKTEEDGGDYYVDGVKVTSSCYVFCHALRRDYAFKGCKFGVENGNIYGTRASVFLYFPDEIYCRGTVGYGDVGVNATINKFYVEADHIHNYKVKNNRRTHHILGSADVAKAVKLVKKHLRKLSLSKIVSLTAYKLTSALSQEKETKSEAEKHAMFNLREMLTRSGALTAELVNMVTIGYEFKDESVREAVVSYMDTIGEDIEVSSRNISIALVLVHPPHSDGADHEITVQRGEKHLNLRTRVYVSEVLLSLENAEVETYTPDTLPENIRAKISTLNILPENSYVDGIGCRQSENIYYIAEDV
jgi:hypothetical protein